MSRLTTRVTASGIEAVYCGRARVGYLVSRMDSDCPWAWEINLVSEQLRGHPNGISTTREAAFEGMTRIIEQWMLAAGMEWSR